MNTHLLTGIALTAIVAPAVQAAEWGTDLPAALQQAASSKKNVLVVFTGSDWCGPCISLKRNVLSKADFAAYAADKFVLVELDYPRGKKQSAAVAAANQKHLKTYGVQGFPTILALSPEGTVLAKTVGGMASLADLKSRIAAGEPSGAAAGAQCEGGVCKPPVAAPSSYDEVAEVTRIEKKIEELEGQHEKTLEFTIQELENSNHTQQIKFILSCFQVDALINLVESEEDAAELKKYLETTIIPAFKADMAEDVKVLEEAAQVLGDKDEVEFLIKENKK